MPKTIFLIPGFKTQITDPLYKELVSYLEKKNYTVKPVPITWKNRTLTKNAEEFNNYFEKNKGKVNYVLGFSYGAVISLMTAKIIKPDKLILCSLSPDFKEDSKMMPGWLIKYIGVNRYLDTKTRSANNLAKSLDIETVILYGEKEGADYPQLKKRSEEIAKHSKKTKLIVVKNAPHDISFPTYIETLKKTI
jgi:esterase/lipase